jgi:hypothetical protein
MFKHGEGMNIGRVESDFACSIALGILGDEGMGGTN